MSKTHTDVVVGVISRVMRTQGFHGSLDVKNVRMNRRGYSARVVASLAGTEKVYLATIIGKSVKITAA